jgi:hypothetical protein
MMNKDRSMNGSRRTGKKPVRQAVKEKPKDKKEGEEWQEQSVNP